MIELSPRLETIFEMVPKSVVADVGSDHGKLIISLVERGVAIKGYAIENKKGPYTTMLNAIRKSGLFDKITPLLSDGISDLPSDVSTVVLAGLGGATIIDILNEHPEKLHHVSTIIVDAHSMIKEVREFICENGYVIADEKIVKEDDIYYEIVKFVRSEQAIYSEEDFEYGPILRQEKGILFKEKYERRAKQIEEIMDTNSLPESRVLALKSELEKIRSVIE